jgi:hypothetical protein
MAKRRFSSRPISDEITMRECRALTFAKCTTIIIAKLAITSGLGSSLDWMVWVWNGWIWFWYGFVEQCDPLCPFVDHTL